MSLKSYLPGPRLWVQKQISKVLHPTLSSSSHTTFPRLINPYPTGSHGSWVRPQGAGWQRGVRAKGSS